MYIHFLINRRGLDRRLIFDAFHASYFMFSFSHAFIATYLLGPQSSARSTRTLPRFFAKRRPTSSAPPMRRRPNCITTSSTRASTLGATRCARCCGPNWSTFIWTTPRTATPNSCRRCCDRPRASSSPSAPPRPHRRCHRPRPRLCPRLHLPPRHRHRHQQHPQQRRPRCLRFQHWSARHWHHAPPPPQVQLLLRSPRQKQQHQLPLRFSATLTPSRTV
jgi:hypothetical protein